jgi:hypothetical protein
LVGSWTTPWVLSKSEVLWTAGSLFEGWGALWLPCKHTSPWVSRQVGNTGNLTCYLVYPPYFITWNGWDSGNYIISLDKVFWFISLIKKISIFFLLNLKA